MVQVSVFNTAMMIPLMRVMRARQRDAEMVFCKRVSNAMMAIVLIVTNVRIDVSKGKRYDRCKHFLSLMPLLGRAGLSETKQGKR